MGNNCFKTISNSICGPSEEEKEKEKEEVPNVTAESESKEKGASDVQNQPPEEIKIVKEGTEREQEGKSKEETQMQQSKPHNVKRQSCAGLKIDSVLQTKTGHLKEYYSLGTKVGNGQFGTTFVCVEKGTGNKFACKSIAKRKLATLDDVEDVRREIQIMHHMSWHPNVVTIKGAYEDPMAVHVVMDLCAGGELFDRIVKRGHYSERKAAELARVIVGFVEACHSMGVMHRDLKPENFLFVNDEEDSPLKAIDFGLSIFFKPGDTFSVVVGSPYYVAPEVLNKCYGPEADVWSAGVIIYILLCGVPPFWGETEEEIFDEVLNGEPDFTSDPWPSISESAKDLLAKMLVRNPKKRITAHEVLRHSWVQADGVAPDSPLDSLVLGRMKQFSSMNKLKKMALRVIAQRLSQEEIAGLKEIFKMIDTDNSGQITFEELKAGLQSFGASLPESEFQALMQAADVNNSGSIDYQEFIAATLHLNMIQNEDNLMAAFSYFDRDGSGYITLEEIQKACQEFGIKDIHMDEMMREVDQDNDGRIDYNEFIAMMQKGNPEVGKRDREGKGLSIGFREALPGS
ncbi:calcium-dependent protein kinase 26-like isoform X6 [Gossypium arboreum]|uniref:calcium-dependent protein kinase 26-like isoform X6 n=1 Tax=Gossypium arboreum TaxID=29729 RepID=UPI0022F16D06|nr:calcium-dependent protein kinase 26-like isoform X6 [Gossypium arboreum]